MLIGKATFALRCEINLRFCHCPPRKIQLPQKRMLKEENKKEENKSQYIDNFTNYEHFTEVNTAAMGGALDSSFNQQSPDLQEQEASTWANNMVFALDTCLGGATASNARAAFSGESSTARAVSSMHARMVESGQIEKVSQRDLFRSFEKNKLGASIYGRDSELDKYNEALRDDLQEGMNLDNNNVDEIMKDINEKEEFNSDEFNLDERYRKNIKDSFEKFIKSSESKNLNFTQVSESIDSSSFFKEVKDDIMDDPKIPDEKKREIIETLKISAQRELSRNFRNIKSSITEGSNVVTRRINDRVKRFRTLETPVEQIKSKIFPKSKTEETEKQLVDNDTQNANRFNKRK